MTDTRQWLNFYTVCSPVHTIRACLKEFHNTLQDKFEKGGPSPKVINPTQTLKVKNPMPFCYLEVSDYVLYILLGHHSNHSSCSISLPPSFALPSGQPNYGRDTTARARWNIYKL